MNSGGVTSTKCLAVPRELYAFTLGSASSGGFDRSTCVLEALGFLLATSGAGVFETLGSLLALCDCLAGALENVVGWGGRGPAQAARVDFR